MITPRKQWFMPTRGQALSLAHLVESNGRLVVTQSNGPALRNFRNTLAAIMGSGVSAFIYYALFPEGVQAWFRTMSAAISPIGLFVFLCVPFLLMVLQSINRLFGKETFIFDGQQGVFIRNGFTVGPLREIRAVTAQVKGNGQYPMFQLVLELPRCETVTIVRTHDIPADGEFHLSGNGFGNPNKRFSMCNPWLDYDAQNLVPFLPPEIVELRQTILMYIGEPVRLKPGQHEIFDR